jgi:putative hemolysin
MLYIELAIVVALILLNGFLALAELAIVSSRRARLQALVDRDVVGSRRALALATNPGRFLSTVQIGITLVGVLSGAFSGATFGLHLAEWFVALGLRASVAEALGVGLVVAVITYLSLVIGELVPKQIALRDPEKIAVRVAPAMTVMATIASPIARSRRHARRDGWRRSGKGFARRVSPRRTPGHTGARAAGCECSRYC